MPFENTIKNFFNKKPTKKTTVSYPPTIINIPIKVTINELIYPTSFLVSSKFS